MSVPSYISPKPMDSKCPLCQSRNVSFLALPDRWKQAIEIQGKYYQAEDNETLSIKNYFCDHCQATDRERLYSLFFQSFFQSHDNNISLLHFAPESQLRNFLKQHEHLQYRSADLFMPDVDDKVDITDMHNYKDDTFDFIICSHILEHIPEDKKALSELHRVLKDKAYAILMAPIMTTLDTTYEDLTITRPEDRLLHFGQEDHVRLYAKNDYVELLKHSGFKVHQLNKNYFGEDVFTYYGIEPSSVLYLVEKVKKPKVQILMLTYNHVDYIEQSIKSVLAQKTNFSFELLIGDDASTDGTSTIVEKYSSLYPDIVKAYVRPKNLGIGKNYKDLYNKISAPYIALIEGDDFWESSEKLQKQTDFLDSHQDFSIVLHRANVLKDKAYIEIYPPLSYAEGTYSLKDIIDLNFTTTASVMYRNSYLKLPVQYDSLTMLDWITHIFHATQGKIYLFNEVMSTYRLHDASVWSSKDTLYQTMQTIKSFQVINNYFQNSIPELRQKQAGFEATIIQNNIINKLDLDSLVALCISYINNISPLPEERKKSLNEVLALLNNNGLKDIAVDVEKEIIYELYRSNPNLTIQKEPEPTKKTTVAFLADPLDTDNYKELTLGLLSPISNLKDFTILPLLNKVNGKYQLNEQILQECSIVIVLDKGAIFSHLFSLIKQAGIPLFFYISTNIWKSPERHFENEYHKALQGHYSNTIILADKVITTNEYLNQYIVRDSQVLTPFIDASIWKQTIHRQTNPSGKLTIAIYSDLENLSSLPLISNVIQTLQKRYKEQADFVLYTFNCSADELRSFNFMDVRLTNISDYIQYVNLIRTAPADIALCPIMANEYNLSRSPFIYFENALSKIPGVYSSFGLFKEVVKHGETGLLCLDESTAWINAVSSLIDNQGLRESMANAAEQQVKQQFSIDNGLVAMHTILSSVPEVQERAIPSKLLTPYSRYDIDSFQNYQEYIKTKTLQPADIHLWNTLSEKWSTTPIFNYFISINTIDSNALNLLANTIDSLTDQLYPDWRLYLISEHPSPNPIFEQDNNLSWVQTDAKLHDAINQVSVHNENVFIGTLHVGERLSPQALCSFCDKFNKAQTNLIYSDHDYIDETGLRNFPHFKPDINLEMLRATNYIAHSFVIHSQSFNQLNGFNIDLTQAEGHDLILRYIDTFGEQYVEHIPEILYSFIKQDNSMLQVETVASKIALTQHMQRNNIKAEVIDAEVERTYRILYNQEKMPLVSILIPTKNQYTYIKACIDSILEKTAYSNYEIIIVDNQSDEKDACDYLEGLKEKDNIHIIYYNDAFNYSTVNNVAAEQAKGEYLLLLNNDTEVLHENWLDVMMSHAQRDTVGIVGARLLYPDNTIQHAGVIIGLSKAADHPFNHTELSDNGYLNRLKIDQELSAVTAAALLIKANVYTQVNRLNDTDYTINFSDVDLCLNVVEAGYKIIWTPHATLLHHGSVTQKKVDVKKIEARNEIFKKDEDTFVSKWKKYILHDPAYNINLDTGSPFMSTRVKALPHWDIEQTSPLAKVYGMARGHDGGGFYRITSPLNALNDAGYIQSSFSYKNYTASYITRTKPDIIVYQTPMHDNHLVFLEYIKTYFPEITLIFEIDDLLTNIPINNKSFYNQYKDSHKRIQKALRLCDKMVVSTKPLKDAFSKYIDDIRIVPNCLSHHVWGSLVSEKNTSSKLRVGWAGSIFHTGDLEIIQQLVVDYKDRVDWVFMGMCPAGMENIIEYHPGVSLDAYPQKLASLNLDLALVPLENNPFNEAKSNLRLLEFGILAWPVICTDIYPYQEAPVTRVKNRYKDWVKALESKISNPELLLSEGELLKKWVLDNYMLEDNLDLISKLYLD